MAITDVITRFKAESTQYEQKIKSAGKQLDNFKSKGSDLSKFLKQFERKMGLSISSLTKFGVAASVAAGALKMAKDAFMATEKNADLFRRETEAAKATYNGFLQALNNGSIDGFLSNMGKIRDAAREAYNATDDLGTMTSFSDIDLQKIQTKRLSTQLAIRQGKANGQDVKALQDELLGYDDEIAHIAEEKAKLAAEAYEKTLRSVVMAGTGGRYESAVAHQYADTWQNFKNVTDDLIEEKKAELDAYMKQNGIGKNSLDYARANYSKLSKDDARIIAIDKEREIAIIQAIKDQENAVLEAKKNQVIAEQALQQAMSTRLNSQRYMSEGKTSTPTSTGPVTLDTSKFKEIPQAFQDLNAQADALTQKLTKVQDFSIRSFSAGSINDLNEQLRSEIDILNTLTIGTDAYNQQLERCNQLRGQLTLEKDGKNAAAAWNAASNAMSGVGSALSSLDDPSAKIVGLIAQAIASVASGAGQAISAKDTTSSGWAWIGAAAAITSEMVAIISTIKSSTQYHANGGFVTNAGLARGTDTVPAMLTPGELVLNRAQQTNLASQLGVSINNIHLSATLRGEDIRLALSNNSRRIGRGEYVTTH